MAVKTITLDMEAYELLSQHKRGNQSFSQVVKEHFRQQQTVGAFRHALSEIGVSAETIDAIDRQVADRGSNPARVVEL